MAIPNPSPNNELRAPADLPLADVSDHPKKRGWLWILALVVLVGGGYYFYKSRGSAESKAAPAPGARGGALGPVSVAVVPALKQNVPYYLSGLGSVTPFNTVTVKSRVDGQLQKVNFQEGQFVREGDLLAEIDPRPFQVALEQMEGQLARDQAQLNNARVDYARYDQLHKEGVVAQQQVDTQNAMVGQLEGAVRADQAQIDNQKLQLVYCKITAPLSGRVGLRLVDQGNMVHSSDPNGLVVITQVQPVAALFTLPEDNLQEVIQHMKNEVLEVDAYSRDDQTKLATGKLVTIDAEQFASRIRARVIGQDAARAAAEWTGRRGSWKRIAANRPQGRVLGPIGRLAVVAIGLGGGRYRCCTRMGARARLRNQVRIRLESGQRVRPLARRASSRSPTRGVVRLQRHADAARRNGLVIEDVRGSVSRRA